MIFLTDGWVVKISKVIILIMDDEKTAVSYRDIPGHMNPPPSSGIILFAWWMKIR
jgi:hypothetical protein